MAYSDSAHLPGSVSNLSCSQACRWSGVVISVILGFLWI